jgi:hypothetical protein
MFGTLLYTPVRLNFGLESKLGFANMSPSGRRSFLHLQNFTLGDVKQNRTIIVQHTPGLT